MAEVSIDIWLFCGYNVNAVQVMKFEDFKELGSEASVKVPFFVCVQMYTTLTFMRLVG